MNERCLMITYYFANFAKIYSSNCTKNDKSRLTTQRNACAIILAVTIYSCLSERSEESPSHTKIDAYISAYSRYELFRLGFGFSSGNERKNRVVPVDIANIAKTIKQFRVFDMPGRLRII
jgi:hypothetical protein